MKKIIILLCLFFVFLSFSPSLYEIYRSGRLPADRAFVLEHNYMFDYNFYLSRIREGQEGRWLVTEKYFNQPHMPSLFQIIYLYLGKLGSIFRLSPPAVYHTARIIFGLILLLLIGRAAFELFSGGWRPVAYLFAVTAGSWPVLYKAGNFYRFGTYMGWWSVIDSLQRITFVPHVLAGQIFLFLFIDRYSKEFKGIGAMRMLSWGILGFIAGIIFPPTLIVVYAFFAVYLILTVFYLYRKNQFGDKRAIGELLNLRIIPMAVFGFLSVGALLYTQYMFGFYPWKALTEFDILHRSILPYGEYFLALGPVFPLGLAGLLLSVLKNKIKFMPFAAWLISVFLLFAVFENVPQQSPTRFTEAALNIPLGLLAAYFLLSLYRGASKLKGSLIPFTQRLIKAVIILVILLGLSVMFSMVLWLTDQVRAKAAGTWLFPAGAELVYPTKDFMSGIFYIGENSSVDKTVLAYEAAGNYIPAYAGNFVFLGHANTPGEDQKLKTAAKFFSGEMTKDEAAEFLKNEHISYVYYGAQEKELGNLTDLSTLYPFLKSVYINNSVTVYKVSN